MKTFYLNRYRSKRAAQDHPLYVLLLLDLLLLNSPSSKS